MTDQAPPTVFELIGEAGFAALARAFYGRIPADPLLGPLYPEQDLAGAEQRLRDFLIFRFGGPPRYVEARGHPALRMRHAPFAIDSAVRDRWVELMDAAVAESQMPSPAAAELERFFAEAATFLINR